MTVCPWCGKSVSVVPYRKAACVGRHDNRNNSGFCKGSLLPVNQTIFLGSEDDDA